MHAESCPSESLIAVDRIESGRDRTNVEHMKERNGNASEVANCNMGRHWNRFPSLEE
jgi:hypothetical protein